MDATGSEIEGEAFFDSDHITRDRKVFSKLMLRSFLKHSISREAHHNAVWMVKEHIARDYKISTELPPHLQPHVLAEKKKQLAAMNKGKMDYYLANGAAAPHLAIRPGPKGGRGRGQLHQTIPFVSYQSGVGPQQEGFPGQPGFSPFPPGPNGADMQAWPDAQIPIPPPIKYPIDDLELPPKSNGIQRPALKFLAKARCTADKQNGSNGHIEENVIDMKSVGLLLEIWNTLNVHEHVFVLDSFTLDDFLEAVRFQNDDLECQLFVEIHCAILKLLVSEKGELLANLPALEDDESEDEEEESEEPSPEPEAPPARVTRGSLRKSEAERLKQEETPPPDPNKPTHRAEEMLAERGWIDRLTTRDFQKGGWQVIMVGVLRQMALDERHKERCEAILRELAPLDLPPTPETARFQYCYMDANRKIDALQIICMLAVSTKSIREYLLAQSDEMTELRKQKIEWQREKKQL